MTRLAVVSGSDAESGRSTVADQAPRTTPRAALTGVEPARSGSPVRGRADTVGGVSDPVKRAAEVNVVPRWVAPTFVVLALLTVPWIAYLAMTLPRRTTTVHYRGAWVGFDIGLVFLLSLTAYLAWRGSRRLEIVATATATTLAIDAWFDVSTTPMPDLLASVLLAVLVELPLATICLWIALHTDALEERRMRQLMKRAARAEATGVAATTPQADGVAATTPEATGVAATAPGAAAGVAAATAGAEAVAPAEPERTREGSPNR